MAFTLNWVFFGIEACSRNASDTVVCETPSRLAKVFNVIRGGCTRFIGMTKAPRLAISMK